MSMNLHCKEMELWQISSYFTYMMAYRYKNIPNPNNLEKDLYKPIVEPKMDSWWNIRERYKLWIWDYANTFYNVDGIRENCEEHIKKLYSFKKLHFYIM